MSATSACVGFCPSARSRSPRTSRGTAPVPFLSNNAIASLYSVPLKPQSPPWLRRGGVATAAHLRYHSVHPRVNDGISHFAV